jgi:hypothetical protein
MSFRDLPTAPAYSDDSSLDGYEAELTELEALLGPFQSAAWYALKAQIEDQLSQESGALIASPYATDQILQARGRCQAFQWVLALPERIQHRMDQVLGELDRARPEVEEDI